MRAKQSILGLVYTGGEVRRPPLVGMQFLHERAVGSAEPNAGLTGQKINSKYLPRYEPPRLAIARGERLLNRYNCTGCHTLAMPQYSIPEGTKVAEAMPSFETNVAVSYDNRKNAIDLLRERGIDILDTRMWVRRMENFPDQHARSAEIVGILTRARGFLGRVNHRGRLADDGKVVVHFPSSHYVRKLSFRAKRGICCLPRPSLLPAESRFLTATPLGMTKLQVS